MAELARKGLRDAYGPAPGGPADYALKRIDLTWADGGADALPGPSGCGKTTLLNIISGLLAPSEGAVPFDGRVVVRATPGARNIAQVLQFPVISDTLTVFDNVAFPLRNRGVAESGPPPASRRSRRCSSSRGSCTAARRGWRRLPSRRSAWAAASCARTSTS
jgi:glycerol transport system ATP-binding protein